jgi:hypothetical protein
MLQVLNNATAPFTHQRMVADGTLTLASALHELPGDLLGGGALPAVVFCPAVSLLAGPAATLLHAWKHDARNLLVRSQPLSLTLTLTAWCWPPR